MQQQQPPELRAGEVTLNNKTEPPPPAGRSIDWINVECYHDALRERAPTGTRTQLRTLFGPDQNIILLVIVLGCVLFTQCVSSKYITPKYTHQPHVWPKAGATVCPGAGWGTKQWIQDEWSGAALYSEGCCVGRSLLRSVVVGYSVGVCTNTRNGITGILLCVLLFLGHPRLLRSDIVDRLQTFGGWGGVSDG